jgi:hypothetical protein
MAHKAHDRAADPNTPLSELKQLAQDSLEVAATVAANPSIDDAVVRVLLKRRSGNISKALASNPSTSFEHLAALAKTHPEQVLANPAFELMLAANPSCIKEIEEESIIRIARTSSADPRCLAMIARVTESGEVARALLANLTTPLSALRSLHEGRLGFSVSLHRNWQPRAADAWDACTALQLQTSACAEIDDTVWLPLLARAGAIDTHLRAAAASQASRAVRVRVLASGALPAGSESALAGPDVDDAKSAIASALIARGPGWEKVVEHLGLDAHRGLLPSGVRPGRSPLGSKATADDVHRAFLRHRDHVYSVERHDGIDPRSYLAVATHPTVSAQTLEAMVNAHAGSAEVRQIAARSHAATPHVRFLSRLSDLLPNVHWINELAALRHASVDPSMIAALAQHAHEEVRVAVAARPDVPPDVLTRLATDSSKAVLLAIAGSESLADESLVSAFCADSTAAVRAAVVGRHSPLPDRLRTKLLADKSAEVRIAFATRRDASDTEQRALASDKSEKVRLALAANPSITADAIAALRTDTTVDLIVALAGNPSVDLAVLTALIEQLPSLLLPTLRDRGAALLKKDETPLHLGTVVLLAAERAPGSRARMIALSHPTCPPDVIERLFDPSAEWPERALIAANPSTPETVRSKLRNDAYWPVSDAAASVQ